MRFERDYKFWKAPVQFAIEVLVGSFIFLVIAVGAVGLSLFIEYLECRRIDAVILYGLKGAKYLLFASDLILFTCFVFKTGVRSWKSM